MRTVFDFSPYRRSTVGFDRLFDTLEAAARGEAGGTNYPPYDIERTGEDAYRITLAIAGFAEDEIELTAQQNLLVVAGKKAEVVANDDDHRYLHRGIAQHVGHGLLGGRQFLGIGHGRIKIDNPRAIELEKRRDGHFGLQEIDAVIGLCWQKCAWPL